MYKNLLTAGSNPAALSCARYLHHTGNTSLFYATFLKQMEQVATDDIIIEPNNLVVNQENLSLYQSELLSPLMYRKKQWSYLFLHGPDFLINFIMKERPESSLPNAPSQIPKFLHLESKSKRNPHTRVYKGRKEKEKIAVLSHQLRENISLAKMEVSLGIF